MFPYILTSYYSDPAVFPKLSVGAGQSVHCGVTHVLDYAACTGISVSAADKGEIQ